MCNCLGYNEEIYGSEIVGFITVTSSSGKRITFPVGLEKEEPTWIFE